MSIASPGKGHEKDYLEFVEIILSPKYVQSWISALSHQLQPVGALFECPLFLRSCIMLTSPHREHNY